MSELLKQGDLSKMCSPTVICDNADTHYTGLHKTGEGNRLHIAQLRSVQHSYSAKT